MAHIDEGVTTEVVILEPDILGIFSFPGQTKVHFGKGRVTNDLYLSSVPDSVRGPWLRQLVDPAPEVVLLGEA
jgi:hypothetical protein